ncbi:MAG TPA: AMP-binding protein, partial [Rhodothermales bacterium]|nr:AMP-binding protein [Rhodothermales bacterium]
MTGSILAPFYDGVGRHPDQLLYAFLDGEGRTTASYTYRAFLDRTTDIATHIRRSHRLEPGARVLLAYPPGLDVIAAFFACVRLGLIPVPVYPAAGNGFQAALGKMDAIARDCGASAVLTDRSYYWSVRLNETRHRVATLSRGRVGVMRLPWIVTTDVVRGSGEPFEDAHSPVAFLQYTSGSTSDPKGVMVTHDNLLDNCEAVVDHRPVGVSWLPQYHDMGLIGYYLFFAMKGGTTYGFSPFDFIRRPALWLETISRYRGTASSAPNFAYEYCLRPDKVSDETLARLDLSSLRFLMTAAEPVRADVVRAFKERFAPCGLDPRSHFSAYGLAEFTLAVSNYGRTARAFNRAALARHHVQAAGPGAGAVELVSCGRPLGAAEVRIVDVSDDAPREVDGDTVGEIWLRGPSTCRGYWGRPELTAATFDAHVAGDPVGAPGWLRTGDMGFVEDGELYVCGRLKDMLIVRGQNVYPQDVEAIIEADAHVRRGCVAAFASDRDGEEALVVVAELRDRGRVPDARVLNQRLQEALGVTASQFVFIEARTIPKTSSGKIARHRVRQQWKEGALRVVETEGFEREPGPAAPPPGRAWLERFGLTGDETWTLLEAGFDSLKLVEFAHALKGQLEADGETELSGAVDLRVLQRMAICELIELLDQVTAAAPLARLRFRKALTDLGEEHRLLEAEMMRQDARLRVDVSGRAGASAPHADDGAILLTGGTGFFGPFLLTALLEQTDAPIHVLVRARDEHAALCRLGEGFQSIAGEGAPLPEGWKERVRPVCGDLSAARFGLDDGAWRDLSDHVGTIYHNGATVNYLLDYAAMRDANVGGTNEVVRLAMARRAKVLNHISTTFIFGWSVQETLAERDGNEAMARLDFGYSQSKWVSEQVVRDAMARELDARIFRPALLTPSVGGGGHNFDIAIRLLAFMIAHGLSTTAGNQVSFSPADLAADNIVAVSRMAESVGHTLHVTRDDYATLADVTAIIAEKTGRDFRYLSLRSFVPEVIQ